MASGTGKKEKGKKNKGKTLNLNEFLAGTPVVRTVQVKKSWADEVEEEQCIQSVETLQLPTAPRAARGVDIDMDRVPTRPPFTAYVGNLPFDMEDEELELFFRGLEISNIRIPEGRVRKFGYVEFIDRATLLEALALDDQKIRNNQIRVDLAEGQNDRGDRDRRSGFDRDRDNDGEDRTIGDWRKKDPSESSFSRDRPSDRFGDRDRGGFGDRDRYGDRDRGSFGDRDRDRGSFGDRDRGSFGDRDRGSFGDRDRYGDRDRDRGSFGGDRDRNRGFGNWDRDRDRDSDRFGDRDGGRRSFGTGYSRDSDRDRGGSGRYGDRYGGRDDRYGYRDRYDRVDRRDDDRGPSRDAGGERPRLKLAPRTKPIEKAATTQPQSQSSIFGGAKPVDTAAREREIEDRLKRQRDIETEKIEQEKESRESRYRLSSSTSERARHGSQSDDGAPRRERKSSSSSGKGIRTVAPPPGAGSARIRRDSTLSEPEDVFDEEKPAPAKPSPKKDEGPAVVAAPPPKENAWAKRKTSSGDQEPPSQEKGESPKSPKESPPKNVQSAPAPKSNAWSKGKPDIIPADPPKENVWAKRATQSDSEKKDNGEANDGDPSFSGSHWGSNKRREGGQQPAGRGDGGAGRGRGAKPNREKREKPLPKSIEEMPQYSEKSDKDWSDTNKFSTLMADADEREGDSDQ